MVDHRNLLKTKDIMKRFNIKSKQALHYWINKGYLKPYRKDPNGFFFTRSEAQRFGVLYRKRKR